MAGFNQLAAHLQITFDDQAFIYDLTPSKILRVDEIDGISTLYDPNQFIETGFRLSKCHDSNEFLA